MYVLTVGWNRCDVCSVFCCWPFFLWCVTAGRWRLHPAQQTAGSAAADPGGEGRDPGAGGWTRMRRSVSQTHHQMKFHFLLICRHIEYLSTIDSCPFVHFSKSMLRDCLSINWAVEPDTCSLMVHSYWNYTINCSTSIHNSSKSIWHDSEFVASPL